MASVVVVSKPMDMAMLVRWEPELNLRVGQEERASSIFFAGKARPF